MITCSFEQIAHLPVQRSYRSLRIGTQSIALDQQIELGEYGTIEVPKLADALHAHEQITNGRCYAQFAALAYSAGAEQALSFYFPLTNALSEQQRPEFFRLIRRILSKAQLNIRLIGAKKRDISQQLPSDTRALIAGHLAELFFYRQDILEQLLQQALNFLLYPDMAAFQADGGVSGGNFTPSRQAIQLLVSRLYEGFNQAQPGTAPFLHEFGHMLDYFHPHNPRISKSRGFLPGMLPEDGAIYTPQARQQFIAGKRLELQRYLRYHHQPQNGSPQPIGHPYVFQNDSEFIAGYLEMFFRNPHYFAQQNPELFQGFALLFRQDPRQAWQQDYQTYVQANQQFYRGSQSVRQPGLHIPEEA